MGRLLSTQQRVAERIGELLRGITVDNGYNTDVCAVEQVFGLPGSDRKKLPQIYHWFGDRTYNTGNNANAQIELRVPLGIAFGVPCERTSAQGELEFIAADIYRALFDQTDQSTQITVPIISGTKDLRVDMDYLGMVPQKVEESGRGVATGVMVYAMRWPQVLGNPALFRPDDVAIEES